MGGYGSGPSGCWKKTTVEECLTLDINRLVRDHVVRRWTCGSRTWTNTFTGERIASVGYLVEPVELGYDDLVLRLNYTRTVRDEKHEVDLPIYLTWTRPHFGGVRWWFTCPLIVRGDACNRRVGKLHLPPGARYFGCRHCHNLTYQSCQDSRKFDAFHELIGANLGVPGFMVKKILDGKL